MTGSLRVIIRPSLIRSIYHIHPKYVYQFGTSKVHKSIIDLNNPIGFDHEFLALFWSCLFIGPDKSWLVTQYAELLNGRRRIDREKVSLTSSSSAYRSHSSSSSAYSKCSNLGENRVVAFTFALLYTSSWWKIIQYNSQLS